MKLKTKRLISLTQVALSKSGKEEALLQSIQIKEFECYHKTLLLWLNLRNPLVEDRAVFQEFQPTEEKAGEKHLTRAITPLTILWKEALVELDMD